MTTSVYTNSVPRALPSPSEHHSVGDIDYAKPIKDGMDYANENLKTSVAFIAGSVFGGYVARSPNLGIKAIAAFGVGAGLTAVALTQDVSKAGIALLDAASQSATNGLMKTVHDYVKANPGTTEMLHTAAVGLAMVNVKWRGNTNLRSVGAGFLLTTVPHVLNYVGKTIYNSCTAQDGHCSQGMAAASTAISDSRQNGWMKAAGDYVSDSRQNGWVKAAGDYASDSRQNGWVKAAGDYVSDSRQNGWMKTVENYTYENLQTIAASAIIGIGTKWHYFMGGDRGYGYPSGFTAGLLTYAVSKAGTALVDVASQIATNGPMKTVHDLKANPKFTRQIGWMKPGLDYAQANLIPVLMQGPCGFAGWSIAIRHGYSDPAAARIAVLSLTVPHVLNHVGKTIYNSCNAQDGYCNHVITTGVDYVRANPITTAVSAIAGIAGSVLGPLYSQTAITRAGALAFNAVMTANIMAAAQHQPVTWPEIQIALEAANNAHSATVLRQTLGRRLVTGLGAAIVPHVLNYVGKTISNSCTAQDGYCSRGITAISKIRIGS